MAKYIEREAAVAIIEEKQKELCPLGRYSRTMVYGSDRDRFDSWQEMINSIEDIPAADVVEVRHGRWISDSPGKRFGTVVRLDKDGCPVGSCHCSECGEWLTASDEYPVIGYYCPNCGAKMYGGADDAAD